MSSTASLRICSLNDQRQIWFQHDGAPSHFPPLSRNFLHNTFPVPWIGRYGVMFWPHDPLTSLRWSFFSGARRSISMELSMEEVVAIRSRQHRRVHRFLYKTVAKIGFTSRHTYHGQWRRVVPQCHSPASPSNSERAIRFT